MNNQIVDALLIGAGAMSTCLSTLLNQLESCLSITMIERLQSKGKLGYAEAVGDFTETRRECFGG